MLKKIIVFLVLALAFLTFSDFNTETFITDLIYQKSENENAQKYSLFEGERRVFIGMSESELNEIFGTPEDVLKSEYGFLWNIYHNDFKNYIQVGVKGGKVVGIYTNSPSFSFLSVTHGTKKDDVFLSLENPINHIIKGNTKYILSTANEENSGVLMFLENDMYITVFYDVLENNSVTSINIIDYGTEQSFNSLFGSGTDELKESFEKNNFYVTNALRAKKGLGILKRHGALDEIALNHSQEMAENNYFEHLDLSGGSVNNRADNARIKYSAIGENIAMGAQNSIVMHELLMNSVGHRKNILGDFSHIGIGVSFSDKNAPYLTQNFLR